MRQKRMKAQHLTRRLRVSSAWSVLLEKEVDTEVHEYRRPPLKNATPLRSQARLPEACFQPNLKDTWKPLGSITSYKDKTDWYAPSASASSARFADLAAVLFCRQRDKLDSLANLWLSFLFDANHCLLVRTIGPDGTAGSPCFALLALPGGTALGWPAESCPIPGSDGQVCWYPSASCACVHYLPVVSFHDWQAIRYTWRSPLSQWLQFPGARAGWPSWHIRAFPVDGETWQPLAAVCAKAGFWAIGMDKLGKLASHLGVCIEAGSKAVHVCKKLITFVLQCSEEEALQYMSNRLECMNREIGEGAEMLIMLDEESGAIDEDEKREFKNAERKSKTRKDVYEDFVHGWCEEKKQVTAAVAKAAAKAQSKSGARKAGGRKDEETGPRVSPYPPVPSGMLTQEQCKSLCPPRSYIWRGLSNGSWQCHLPPWPRGHFSWSQYGANEAALEALRYLWRCHLREQSLSEAECPVAGLFDGSRGQPPAGSASSSSAGPPQPAPKAKAKAQAKRMSK